MTVPQATVIQRIRLHLGDKPWETSGSAADGTTPYIGVANGEDWEKGDIGEFATDGDTFRVDESPSDTLSTVRSYYGSTGAAHAASSRILKNPKYHYSEVVNAISATIQAFLPTTRVYKVTATAITPDIPNTVWYDLNAEAFALVSAFQTSDGRVGEYGAFHEFNRINFRRNLPASLVASGVGVSFPDGFHDADSNVFINYARKITDLVTTSAYVDFSDGDAITEAVIYGSVAMLQGSLELRKPRKGAQETNNLNPASYFNRIYRSALAQAEKELRQKSPLMQT